MYRLGVCYYWKYGKAYIFTIRTIAVQNVHPEYICHWHPPTANITRRANSHWREFRGAEAAQLASPNLSKLWQTACGKPQKHDVDF